MTPWVQVALTVLGSGGAAWLAVTVKIEWLRADVNRHDRHLEQLDARVRELEISR